VKENVLVKVVFLLASEKTKQSTYFVHSKMWKRNVDMCLTAGI